MINLKEEYGSKYHVTYEEGCSGSTKGEEHYQYIPCKHGSILPNDDKTLRAYSKSARISKGWAREIDRREWPDFVILQQGDEELTVSFPVEAFDKVADLLKPKKRRRLRSLKPVEIERRQNQGRKAANKAFYTRAEKKAGVG